MFFTTLLCNQVFFFILLTNYNVMFFTQLFKDARYFQIIFQCIFLSYGIYFLHWNNEYWLYSSYFISCLATQFLCEWLMCKKHIPFWKRYAKGIPSVLISALGLSLLLKTNDIGVAIFASLITIASKYILRIKGKHIFNPSAFGIVAAVLITNDAWISPGQWGSNAVILFAFLSLGFIITTRVQKLDVSLAFLGTFAALIFIRQIIYLGWPVDHFVQSVSTGSLLIFSFFMITDPKTIPNHTLARIIWSIVIAAISFYLTVFEFINAAPIFVLVLAQPLVPLLDKLFKAKKFEWAATNYTAQEKEFLHIIYSRSSF